MTKLVNHVGHFPMGGGAAQLNSNVLETDDSATLEGAELATEIFNAPNVQVRGFTGCCFSWKLPAIRAKNMSGKNLLQNDIVNVTLSPALPFHSAPNCLQEFSLILLSYSSYALQTSFVPTLKHVYTFHTCLIYQLLSCQH